MKLSILYILNIFLCSTSLAALPLERFNVNNIHEELSDGADVVIRSDDRKFILQSRDKATYVVSVALTVLNQQGDKYAPLAIFYDQQRRVSHINGAVYDASGKLIETISEDEVLDVSVVADASLYSHNRLKFYAYDTEVYPYTITFSYQVEYDGLFSFPSWEPLAGERVAVEHADFRVIVPEQLALRYSTFHQLHAPMRSQLDGKTVYYWQLKQLRAVQHEVLSPDISTRTPLLLLAPGDFEYGGIEGKMEDWKALGSWLFGLNDGIDQLPAATVDEVISLTSKLADKREKVLKVFAYMQAKTRPLTLPYGMGGYQPLAANVVDSLAHGDSKALTNYMQALLKVVGIPSTYALIKSGREASPVYENFAAVQFNQAILAVPLADDTLWLDCIDRTQPAGYLGYDKSDRHVLLLEADGGKLVKTRAYHPEENLQARHAIVALEKDGSAQVQATTRYEGLQYSHISALLAAAVTEQEQLIYQKTHLNDFKLQEYSYRAARSERPYVEENLVLDIAEYAKMSGGRLVFTLNLMNQMDGLPPLTSDRKHDISFTSGFSDIDTIEYLLPEGTNLITAPEEVQISSRFGEYQTSFSIKEGKVFYVRMLKTHRGKFPAAAYEELQAFYEKIVRADQRKLVLALTD
jgi:hypothetical protein